MPHGDVWRLLRFFDSLPGLLRLAHDRLELGHGFVELLLGFRFFGSLPLVTFLLLGQPLFHLGNRELVGL